MQNFIKVVGLKRSEYMEIDKYFRYNNCKLEQSYVINLNDSYRAEIKIVGNKNGDKKPLAIKVDIIKDGIVVFTSKFKSTCLESLLIMRSIEITDLDIKLYYRFKLILEKSQIHEHNEYLNCQFNSAFKMIEANDTYINTVLSKYDLNDSLDFFVVLRVFCLNYKTIDDEVKEYFKQRLLYFGYDEEFIEVGSEIYEENLNGGVLTNLIIVLKILYNKTYNYETADDLIRMHGLITYVSDGIPF